MTVPAGPPSIDGPRPAAAGTPGPPARRAAGRRTRPPPHPGGRVLVLVGGTSLLPAVALLVLAPVLHRHDVGASPAFLLAGLLLGLPHGAVDHLVPAWLSARARPPAARLAVPLGYAALAGAALVVFRAVPTLALVGFLALSVAHFGAADEAFHAERDGRPVRQPVSGVLARGGPPVVVPLLLWPDAVDPLLAAVAPGVPELLTVEVRALATVCLLAAVARTVLRDVRAGRRADAAEPVLLLGLFAAVPPALAIGVYFATWHSARHVARLLHGDPGNRADLAAGRLGRPLRRFARRAALPTVAAATALAALAVGPGRPVDLLPATVAVLAALTVPHSALVAWMDRRARPRHPSNPRG